MKTRRQFLHDAMILPVAAATAAEVKQVVPGNRGLGGDERAYCFGMLRRIAEPVLRNLTANKLRERMPVEAGNGKIEDRKHYTYLEAFGRVLTGIAPWLECSQKPAAELEVSKQFAEFARRCLANATNPTAPDFMNFTSGAQPLVDAAFLVQGLLRAKNELWELLEGSVKKQVLAALQGVRKIKPGNNNWLLFSAMIETFLATVGAEWNPEPIDRALSSHEEWYKGDGMYADGPEFHWDYYNSYVIQAFLVEILEQMNKVTPRWSGLEKNVLRRAVRYAAIQERLVAPDGSFPALGRSLAYRCGAFHLLALMALRKQLPEGVTAAQVRGALAAVIHRTMDPPQTFDQNGWLQIGLAGHQPSIAEAYISTGSLYLCSVAFLPMGLSPTDPFWSDPAADWSSRKIWSGKNSVADHALSLK